MCYLRFSLARSQAGPNPGTELCPPCLVKCQGAISTVGLQRPSMAYRSLGFTRSVRDQAKQSQFRTLKLQVMYEIHIMTAVGDSHRNCSCNDGLSAGTR